MAEKILFAKEKSWFTGYNVNVDKKYKGKCLIYAGGQIRFREFITNEKFKIILVLINSQMIKMLLNTWYSKLKFYRGGIN